MHYQRWHATGTAGEAARRNNRHDPEVSSKPCSRCKQLKLKSAAFHRDPKHSDGFASICKKCFGVQVKASRILRKYGLTRLQYLAMQDLQSGRCAICDRMPDERGLVVDHCHASGRVRKLLCNNCNALLGMAADNIQTLKSAIQYLETHT